MGSTSYVIAGDLVANAWHLAGRISDMELVLFHLNDGTSNLPDTETIHQLALIGQQTGLTYTVHLPRDLRHTPCDGSLELAQRVIAQTRPLNPCAYVFHLEGTQIDDEDWLPQARHCIEILLPLVNNPSQLALENLENYAPELLEPVFSEYPIARTLDIGHLWKQGRNPLPVIERWLAQTRVVHLHGMAENDHRSLDVMPFEPLDSVMQALIEWSGIVTLEVFEHDFESSYTALNASLERLGCT